MRVRAVSIALLLSDVVVIGGGIVEGDNVECSVIIIGIAASAIVVLVVVGSSVNSGVVVKSEASWPPHVLGPMLDNLQLSSICPKLQSPLCNSLSTFALPRNCNFLGNTQNNSLTTDEFCLNFSRLVSLDVVVCQFWHQNASNRMYFKMY